MLSLSKRTEIYYYSIGIIALLFLLLFCTAFSTPLMFRIFGVSAINSTILLISRMLYWICVGLLWLYCIRVEKQKLLIWEDRSYSYATYLVSVILLFVVLILGMFIISRMYLLFHLNKPSLKMLELTNIFRQHKILLVFTALTAGVTEELMFRGYMQPRLEVICRNSWAAIFISSALFGLLHFGYGTLINMIGPFFIGFVFAYYYRQYRNIKVLIICHFLWDLCTIYILINTPRA